MFRYLEANGWRSTRFAARADLVVVVTCGGFQQTEERSLLSIRDAARRARPAATIVATGCLTRIDPEALARLEGVTIIQPEDLGALDGIISAGIPFDSTPFVGSIPDVQDLKGDGFSLARLRDEFSPTRSFVRSAFMYVYRKLVSLRKSWDVFPASVYNVMIARGCNGHCTYCAIRVGTGPLVSRPIADVVASFRQGLSEGYHRFVLIAEDIGSYGTDTGVSLVDLLEAVFAIEADYELILNDCNIQWFVEYGDRLMGLLERNRDRIIDIRIPVQSGSDQVLRRMGRRYRSADVRAVVGELHRRLPDVSLKTHVLVGFPGETDEDVALTLALLAETRFDAVKLYCYEDRPGTPASRLPDKVPDAVKRRRYRQLSAYGVR